MNIIVKDSSKRPLTHEEIVQRHVGGPKESYIGSGPGITAPIGVNAGRMVDLMLSPEFVEDAFENAHERTLRRRLELDEVGAIGKYTGAKGMSKNGDLQYAGWMPMPLFQTLLWTDPTLFDDERRLMAYLKKAGLANAT